MLFLYNSGIPPEIIFIILSYIYKPDKLNKIRDIFMNQRLDENFYIPIINKALINYVSHDISRINMYNVQSFINLPSVMRQALDMKPSPFRNLEDFSNWVNDGCLWGVNRRNCNYDNTVIYKSIYGNEIVIYECSSDPSHYKNNLDTTLFPIREFVRTHLVRTHLDFRFNFYTYNNIDTELGIPASIPESIHIIQQVQPTISNRYLHAITRQMVARNSHRITNNNSIKIGRYKNNRR